MNMQIPNLKIKEIRKTKLKSEIIYSIEDVETVNQTV
jgi:hypothetical protein